MRDYWHDQPNESFALDQMREDQHETARIEDEKQDHPRDDKPDSHSSAEGDGDKDTERK